MNNTLNSSSTAEPLPPPILEIGKPMTRIRRETFESLIRQPLTSFVKTPNRLRKKLGGEGACQRRVDVVGCGIKHHPERRCKRLWVV
jgi:hypothetical protein